MMTIQEFFERHSARHEVRHFVMANCRDMDHAWKTLRPDWLVWLATRPGVLDEFTLRLFAVWSARQVDHLMTEHRSIAALDVAKRHANGQATDAELASAWAAFDAAWAAWDAAWAAWAAFDAERAAASAAARDEQADWLRANAKPCFEGGVR